MQNDDGFREMTQSLGEKTILPRSEVDFEHAFLPLSFPVRVTPRRPLDFCRDDAWPESRPADLEIVSITTILHAQSTYGQEHPEHVSVLVGCYRTGDKIVVRVRNNTNIAITCEMLLAYMGESIPIFDNPDDLATHMMAVNAQHDATQDPTPKKEPAKA